LLLGSIYLVPGSSTLAAQTPTDAIVSRGLDLERQGRYDDAVAAFKLVLSREPTNAPALLGAERVLTQVGRRDSIMAMAQRALAADPTNQAAWTIETRTARAMGGETMAAEVLGRWMAAAPQSEGPYRELVRSLISVQRFDDARQAVMVARTRFNDPDKLQPELANVEAAAGNWSRAAAEWRGAVSLNADLIQAATFSLMPTPPAQRDRVVRALTEVDSATSAFGTAAELLLNWNQPERAWQTLQHSLPASPVERRGVLQSFADRARAQDGQVPQRVAAAVLERIAEGLPPAEAARYRIESARAFAASGDQPSARRVLRAMADDSNAPAGVASSATATLVELYAKDGNVDEAAHLLTQNRSKLAGSEADRLAHVVARGWIATGKLDRADSQVAGDESLAAEEIRGWTALYRGDLVDAREWLKSGGAPTRGPESARNVDRAGILALLDAVKSDTLAALGSALFLAARGDTAAAARALVALARGPAHTGQAELLHLAALYARAAGDASRAEALWTEVADHYPTEAPAPIAILALARLQAARGDNADAITRIEALILNYPQSAMVPEARRELDRVRGAVPRS
jgi:tetratricopeptide (TPR) repeat protein